MIESTQDRRPNRLIGETSPYLLQHAYNPVAWFPWGDEALTKARAEDKPIFLSIGYAACHWCHVMEHESFESAQIAEFLNEHYVSIKVDREQRPDLDHIYMTFTQAMVGQGGWPMSVFLTPDLKPFFAGTYFPPDDRHGRPGFMRVITEIIAAYKENRDEVVKSADDIFEQIEQILQADHGQAMLLPALYNNSVQELMKAFDHQHGGFGSAPKFPHALELSLFLRHYAKSGDLTYLQAAEKALLAMARGGIHDQLGGGFARYSTDAQWLVPHFEKMLYDNALLVPTYAEAYQVTGNQVYLDIVRSTLDFILREMSDPAGGFYSSLDADSEGHEGKFYVWPKDEIERTLGAEAQRATEYFNVTSVGNFEGVNILHLSPASDRIQAELGDTFPGWLQSIKAKLFDARSRRVRPSTDDKILTSWNGLALTAFCRGYQVTGDPQYLIAARRNARFVMQHLSQNGGLLTHSYRDGKHSDGRFLEDYAYYLRGLLDLYESDTSAESEDWLRFARTLADHALDLFQDPQTGTLFLREANQPDLIVRPKDETDTALPAPGSLLIGSLLRLERLTGNLHYGKAAELGLRAVSGHIERYPTAMASALIALEYYIADRIEIVIVGSGDLRDQMLETIYRKFLPNRVLAMSATGQDGLPLFEGRSADPGQVRAFVCRNSVCRLPVTTVDALQTELAKL